jgi:hypothetical protein
LLTFLYILLLNQPANVILDLEEMEEAFQESMLFWNAEEASTEPVQEAIASESSSPLSSIVTPTVGDKTTEEQTQSSRVVVGEAAV